MEEVGGGRSCSRFQILFKEALVSIGECLGFFFRTQHPKWFLSFFFILKSCQASLKRKIIK